VKKKKRLRFYPQYRFGLDKPKQFRTSYGLPSRSEVRGQTDQETESHPDKWLDGDDDFITTE
jgi:hypothetical protein